MPLEVKMLSLAHQQLGRCDRYIESSW